MSIVRSDDQSNLVDDLGRIYQRDRGIDNDATLIWRNSSATDWIIDADNAGGLHANFGGGKLLVTDTDTSLYTPVVIHQGGSLQLNNATDTNSVQISHSGTTSQGKINGGWWCTTLNVSPSAIVATAGGDIYASHALNLGTTASATVAGTAWFQTGLSLGTFISPATAGDFVTSGAVNVGNAKSATAPGTGWFQTGLSLGTYLAPTTAGDLVTTGAISCGPAKSATIPGTGWFSAGLSVGTYTAPATGGLSVSTTTTGSANRIATFNQASTAATSYGIVISSAATTGTGTLFEIDSGGQPRFYVWNTGGVSMMGTADMGAGTINVSANLFKNGASYNSPAYALEQWATGEIVKHADKEGAAGYRRLGLTDAERYVREHFELPGHITSFGLFDGGDWLLEKLEEAWTHIFELHHRLEALERKAA